MRPSSPPCLRLRRLPLFLALALSGSAFAARQLPSDARREVAGQTPALRLGIATEDGVPTALLPKAKPLEVLGHGTEFGEQAILRRRAQVEPWSASLAALLAFTDNAGLTPSAQEEDSYLRTGLSFSYTNRVKGSLFVDVSLTHDLFRYAEFDALDFDDTRFEAGLLWQLPWLADAFFATRYAYERIAEPFGGHLFDNHSVVLQLQKVWKVSRGQQVFIGLTGDVSLTADPFAAQRDEYTLVLGYNARLTQRITAQSSYRLGWYRYDSGGRNDWNQILSLGLTFDATDRVRFSATTSFSRNTSNRHFAEYDNLVGAVGLNLHLSF